ncbi:hypothetical protein CBM2606_A40036 [Cupriavidus taiwanensis]|nr:hypothetical protein CBM2606_A40036 [Cupriavidus taiwanensis]
MPVSFFGNPDKQGQPQGQAICEHKQQQRDSSRVSQPLLDRHVCEPRKQYGGGASEAGLDQEFPKIYFGGESRDALILVCLVFLHGFPLYAEAWRSASLALLQLSIKGSRRATGAISGRSMFLQWNAHRHA